MADARDALITGIGLVSSLGEGPEEHWQALNPSGPFRPVVDTERLAPFIVHPIVPLALDSQIPKKGDQRQMEPWQRIGTYAAGLALDQAGVKGDRALLAEMDMIVAAGGGERDYATDEALLGALAGAEQPEVLLNERLMADLRPTLFLAQLSNLLAGNISVVHGVVGSSRTFMGEEAAGADAIRTAWARIASGQGEIFLVGGSFNAERPDILLQYEMSRLLLRDEYGPVWERKARGGGLVFGSLGCFFVIESSAHAERRGARAWAKIAAVTTDRCRRAPGEATANAERALAPLRPRLEQRAAAVVSGASGVAAPTGEEEAFLKTLGLPVRATANALGHSLEPSFPASLALAAIALAKRRLFAPLAASEAPMERELRQALVTSWGHWRGEALALLEVPEEAP